MPHPQPCGYRGIGAASDRKRVAGWCGRLRENTAGCGMPLQLFFVGAIREDLAGRPRGLLVDTFGNGCHGTGADVVITVRRDLRIRQLRADITQGPRADGVE
ncbi:hypothetical protein D3C76_1418690 [compost metagenome]